MTQRGNEFTGAEPIVQGMALYLVAFTLRREPECGCGVGLTARLPVVFVCHLNEIHRHVEVGRQEMAGGQRKLRVQATAIH